MKRIVSLSVAFVLIALNLFAGDLTVTGKLGVGTTNLVSSLTVSGGSANWNETTPGLTPGSFHLNPGSAADHFGSAITFGASDSGNGDNAQAGIYLRSEGTYGTKMYFSTTDDYVTGSKTRMMLDHAGNVGIGTPAPGAKLDVRGYTFLGSNTSGGGTGDKRIKFTDVWTGHPETTYGSEISNDTGTYKTLMIVGNRSNDGSTRRVGIWDYLTVNGGMNVTGSAQASTMQFPNGFQIQQGASNYGQFNSWVHLNGYYGLYSVNNAAHIYPNDSTYGAWKITGTRNTYGGINYNGKTVLMMQDDLIGLYNEYYGRWVIYGYGSNGNTYIAPNGGNVGIGTTNPGAKLEVNGGVRFSTSDAKPQCDANKRGTIWYSQSTSGDSLEVCTTLDGTAYVWKPLTSHTPGFYIVTTDVTERTWKASDTCSAVGLREGAFIDALGRSYACIDEAGYHGYLYYSAQGYWQCGNFRVKYVYCL